MIIAGQNALEQLDAFIDSNLRNLNTAGLVIGLTDRSKLLHLGAHGFADIAAQTLLNSDHLFEIGSISKSFTSILLLQAQERGLVDIHKPVSSYLPWFQIQSRYPQEICLHHLMSHTAGIIEGSDTYTSAFCEAWNLRNTQTGAPPGEYFHYSNSGYKVLGLVLEEVYQQSLADILFENILSPLGMQSTDPVITHNTRRKLAVGYVPFYDDRPFPRGGLLSPATWLESDTADGSISSNAADMCRYLRMLLNRGAGILSSESFEQLINPVIATNDGMPDEQYCFGLSINEIESYQFIGHSGCMVGYTADIEVDLQAGLGVVVLCNGPSEPETIARYALSLWRAARNGDDLPEPPKLETRIFDNADPTEGVYISEGKSLVLRLEDQKLVLEYEGDTVKLERQNENQIFAHHPAFNRFLLTIERENGSIIGLSHGAKVYNREGCSIPAPNGIPQEWKAYPGHYRSHNPWYSNFRVVLRTDKLILIYPHGDEVLLVPMGTNTFRLGEEPCSPETIRFDQIYQGKAYSAYLSGGDYCRTFTP